MQNKTLTNQAERRQKGLARGLLLLTVVGAMALPLVPAVGAQNPTSAATIGFHHFPNGTYRMIDVPAGWTCDDDNVAGNTPVLPGDLIAGPDPSVTCTPPAALGPYAPCTNVVVAGYHLEANAPGTATGRATCNGTPLLSKDHTFGPTIGSGASSGSSVGWTAFTCKVDETNVAAGNDWWVDCSMTAGIPPLPNVPTLSQWGVVGMVAALGGIGVLAISRRSK